MSGLAVAPDFGVHGYKVDVVNGPNGSVLLSNPQSSRYTAPAGKWQMTAVNSAGTTVADRMRYFVFDFDGPRFKSRMCDRGMFLLSPPLIFSLLASKRQQQKER